MVDSLSRQILSVENQRSLNSLQRAIVLSSGRRFSLILAHCNYAHLQTHVIEHLHQDNTITVREIAIATISHTLYTAIKSELDDDSPQAIVITELAQNENLEALLVAANQVREEFRKQFACPLVLWVTDNVLTQMVRLAPDFYSWATSPITFQLSSSELQTFLRQQTDQLFISLLNPSRKESLDKPLQTNSCILSPREVKAARHDLQPQQITLNPDLEASLQFVLGQENHDQGEFQSAIDKYQASFKFWQQRNHLERQGIVLLHLGYSYLAWGEIEPSQREPLFLVAEQYFQDCLSTFDKANRPDLKAKFISDQGDVLKYLKRWDELNLLLQEAQELHKVYPNAVGQARVSELLAEIALHYSHNHIVAIQHVERALQLIENNSNQGLRRGRYGLLLAEGLKKNQQPQAAIKVLRQARAHFRPNKNAHHYIRKSPQVYIQILEQLRSLYFEQKQYLQAFHFKREKLVIESQYGFRAFIGAGRLRPNRQKSITSDSLGTIAEEIIVSGRQQDVEKLKERISRNDYVLTILHGQLGVGKSSLIQAGLIPAIEASPINARDTLVVLLRSYLNWKDKLKKKLDLQLQEYPSKLSALSSSKFDLLNQLEENDRHNFQTVLIFDQFEEFFVNYPNSFERQAFFEFLSRCLEIPFTKVILSLREDYLHHLLEWEKYNDLECIDSNILSKHHRYELNNFSIKNAQAVIQELTARFHLSLEPELISRLVQDLALEDKQVRPIELQVVGAQLYEDKIRTLKQYQELSKNPKETLVRNYLEGVIRDCGPENRQAAELILFVLTGENNTRPSKTREELETDLQALERDLLPEPEKLDLILKIFKESGLVFLLPERPADRYQLVHDYLVEFIRKQQPRIDKLVKELEEKKVELRIAQLEKENAESQQKVVEERQKRAEAELAVEKNRKFKLVLASLLAIISVTSIFSFALKRNQIQKLTFQRKTERLYSYVDELDDNIIPSRLSHAKYLYKDNKLDESLIEMLYVSFYLREKYSVSGFSFEGNESTLEESILFFQKLISEKKYQEENLVDVNEENVVNFSENLTDDQYSNVLKDLMEVGCTLIRKEKMIDLLGLEYSGKKLCPKQSEMYDVQSNH